MAIGLREVHHSDMNRPRRKGAVQQAPGSAHGDCPPIATWRSDEPALGDDCRRSQAAVHPTLKQLLLSDEARAGLLIPPRGAARRRKVIAAN